jgi:hypothetical protein
MEPVESDAPMLQQPVQYHPVANHPEALRRAQPVLERGAMSDPSEPKDFDLVDPRAMAVRQLLVGTMLVVVGVLVTAATYSSAHLDGDRYHAFGPIVIGAIAMVRGFIGLVRP